MARFDSKSLTEAQYRFCRLVESSGLASYSQAVKAFNRNDSAQIEAWKKAISEKQSIGKGN